MAPLNVAIAVCMSVQYGHLMLAAIARPRSSLYFGGISVLPSWYFFMSGQSCMSVSLGMAFMKPGIMPRVFFMSLSVSSYSPIFVSPF